MLFKSDILLSVATNFLITKHFFCHVAFDADVDAVATVIGKKLPDDLILNFSLPVRWLILWTDMEIIHPVILMNGLAGPEHLVAIVAVQEAMDAQWSTPRSVE